MTNPFHIFLQWRNEDFERQKADKWFPVSAQACRAGKLGTLKHTGESVKQEVSGFSWSHSSTEVGKPPTCPKSKKKWFLEGTVRGDEITAFSGQAKSSHGVAGRAGTRDSGTSWCCQCNFCPHVHQLTHFFIHNKTRESP